MIITQTNIADVGHKRSRLKQKIQLEQSNSKVFANNAPIHWADEHLLPITAHKCSCTYTN